MTEKPAHEKRALKSVVDDMFSIAECVHCMLNNWTKDYHSMYIQLVMRYEELERELLSMGYDEAFSLAVKTNHHYNAREIGTCVRCIVIRTFRGCTRRINFHLVSCCCYLIFHLLP